MIQNINLFRARKISETKREVSSASLTIPAVPTPHSSLVDPRASQGQSFLQPLLQQDQSSLKTQQVTGLHEEPGPPETAFTGTFLQRRKITILFLTITATQGPLTFMKK